MSVEFTHRTAQWLQKPFGPPPDLLAPQVVVLDVRQATERLADRDLARRLDVAALADALADGYRLRDVPTRSGPASVSEVRVERTLRLLHQCTTRLPLPDDLVQPLLAVAEVASRIRDTPVWNTTLFDDHRVRLDLDDEVRAVATRLRRLASLPAALVGDTRAEVLSSTAGRVRGLSRYAEEVAACQRAQDRLHEAESYEQHGDRLLDVVASTAPDRHEQDHTRLLAAEAEAARDALRLVVDLVGHPLPEVGHSR